MRVSNKVYIKDVYSHEEGKLNKKNTIIERIKRKKDQDKKDQ